MLRKLAANTLSARQKSIIRKLMFDRSLYSLREVEKCVQDVVLYDKAATFCEIGANDGYLSDPLNLAIYRFNLRGAFIEPQPFYFGELQKTYAGFPGIQFIRAAIADKPGRMKLFSFEMKSGKLPRWANGTGSLSCSQMLRYKDQIPDAEKYIVESEVDCMTVQQLFQCCTIKDPDILVIDAEGLDYQILSQFDLKGLNTKLIIFETESMGEAEQTACLKQIEEADFTLVPCGQDAIAIRRSTITWRSGRCRPLAVSAARGADAELTIS